MRDAAVVIEVAVSLTLLVGAGLLMHSFVALREVNLGLQADHVFKTFLLLPPDRYKTAEQVSTFFRPVLARVKAIPGVMDAAESSAVPPDERPGQQDRGLRQIARGAMACTGAKRQRGILSRPADSV